MQKEKIEPPTHFNIDSCFYNEYSKIKEKNKENPEHYATKLEFKDILTFAIALSIKNKRKPRPSKKSHWFLRTAVVKDEDRAVIQSLIFSYTNDISLILPENYERFYKLSEELANASMDEVLELLETPGEIEKQILLQSKKIIGK